MILAPITTRRERVHLALRGRGYTISINGYQKHIDGVVFCGRYYEWTALGVRHELWTGSMREEGRPA